MSFFCEQPLGKVFHVKFKEISKPETWCGTITRTSHDSEGLGYAYNFGCKLGFFADASSDCVGENFECFTFLQPEQTSLREKTLTVQNVAGTSKVLTVTHQNNDFVFFNGEIAPSGQTWDALVNNFC